MKSITLAEVQQKIKAGEPLVLIDVREQWERDADNIGGLHIPMDQLMERMDEIPKDVPVVIYCKKGIRSQIAIQRLETKGYQNVLNLSSGIG